MKLSIEDFKYYKDVINKDEEAHKEGMKKNLPEEVLNMYEGLIQDMEVFEDYMFIAVLTTVPTLFYQFPRSVVKAKNGSASDYSAALMEAMLGQYINDVWEIENQLAILDAYLGYGFGVMKIGYNSRMGEAPANKPSILTGKTQGGDNKQGVETEEYIKFEKPVLERVSPKFTFLDSERPFHKPQRITFQHKRNLKQLMNSRLYSLDAKFVRHFQGRADNDPRKVSLDLYEHFCILEGGVYKLCFVKDWDEPLFWGKTTYKELPVSLLRFNKTCDKLYAVSHGKLAYNAQKELQYLNELWKQHVDKIRRQHLIDTTGLSESGKQAIKHNDIDGIIECNRPPAGIYAQVGSNPMGKDVYANIENVRNYLKLLLSTTGGRGGETNTEFAETEKQQAAGDFMRMGGMQDNIRDFIRQQLRLTISNIYDLGSPEMTIKITAKDVRDPETGEILTGKLLQLGGEDGLSFQDEIQGDITTDYLYDVDITSAARPDFAVVRKQLAEAITLATSLRSLVNEKGKDIDIAQLLEDYLNSFDALPNPSKYFVDLSPEDKQMMDMKRALSMQKEAGGIKPGQPTPEETAIQTGAQQI